ncbi:MAG: dihydrofolate reductase [Bacteroidales bacterium]|nr:dihydrofolate reductase [Bacteroidales bacterium]
MSISIIVAVTANNAIGAGGDLLFHIADDLRRFKAVTMEHPVVMGRRTFQSLPKGPLPGRLNVVVSRTMPAPADGSYSVVRSLADAVALASEAPGGEEVFIIGGGEIYREALPMVSKIYLTEINATVENADTFFPKLDDREWAVVETSDTHTTSSGTPYRFVTLERK